MMQITKRFREEFKDINVLFGEEFFVFMRPENTQKTIVRFEVQNSWEKKECLILYENHKGGEQFFYRNNFSVLLYLFA